MTRGTIFHGTRKPLRLWFQAARWLTAQRHGSSTLGLQRSLSLGQYKTAWTWLHKLRRAMVRPGRDRLSGRVEVDETYVGGPARGARGRQLGAKQALVLVAAEEAGAGIGRIRLRRVADASAPSLEAFVREAVESGSVVRTDGWTGYARLSSLSYQHEVVVTSGDEQRVSRHFPRVHRVASLLKRSLPGTHEGAVRPSYLDYYGRIHVSLQPPDFPVVRQAVPTPDGASGSGRSRPSPADAGCCPWQGYANGPRSTGVRYIARSGNSSSDSVRKTTRVAKAIESTVLLEAGSSATATAQSGNS